jgi:hypothetical protein
MGRREKSTNRRVLLGLLLAAFALAMPANALADPAAVDEYSLGPVGTRVADRSEAGSLPSGREPTSAASASNGSGVVGETQTPDSPLSALGSLASPLVWIIAGVVVLLAGALLLPTRRTSIAP